MREIKLEIHHYGVLFLDELASSTAHEISLRITLNP
jgi:hypothetical protein